MEFIALKMKSNLTPKDIVAIVGFQSDTEPFTSKVIDDLIEELLANNARVVDRQHLEEIRSEQDYQLSGYVDDQFAVSIGHELGATVIIVGKGENMADYCRFSLRMINLETREVLTQTSRNVAYDSTMRRLLSSSQGNGSSGKRMGIGTTRFAVGGRLGAGFEINTADEDMVGTGYSPNEKSNIAFNAALYGAFRFNDTWAIQPEVNFMVNNGMEISGHGSTIKIGYPTIDIPLLVRWNFIQSPIVVGILAGPYISFPIGKLNLTVNDKGSALDTRGYTFGVTGGFALGFKVGPGYITADARYINDFNSLFVKEDFGDGVQDANICVRRSINITIGYEFSLFL
jgi:hypothetical protein